MYGIIYVLRRSDTGRFAFIAQVPSSYSVTSAYPQVSKALPIRWTSRPAERLSNDGKPNEERFVMSGACVSCHKFHYSVDETRLCETCRERVPLPIAFQRDGKLLVPVRYGGRILLPEDWFEIKRQIERFYLSVPSEEIERRNKERLRKQAKEEERQRTMPSGYVYILQAENGCYKIGRTNNMEKRIKAIRRDYPLNITVLHYFPCKDMISTETALHRRFADNRLQGDWFRLDASQAAWLVSLTEEYALA